jgi:hypothetical protein
MSFHFPFFCKIKEQEGGTGPALWELIPVGGGGGEERVRV